MKLYQTIPVALLALALAPSVSNACDANSVYTLVLAGVHNNPGSTSNNALSGHNRGLVIGKPSLQGSITMTTNNASYCGSHSETGSSATDTRYPVSGTYAIETHLYVGDAGQKGASMTNYGTIWQGTAAPSAGTKLTYVEDVTSGGSTCLVTVGGTDYDAWKSCMNTN